MKITVFVAVILLIGCRCFGQEKERSKNAFTYSAGIAYNQIWLQSNLYGTDEYGILSSSPFNWGITPYFSMAKGRLVLSSGINYSSCSRTQEYDSDITFHSIEQDMWQEASLTFAAGFRVTGERQRINVTPFLGFDFSYLINYEKTLSYYSGAWTRHFDTDQLDARDYHDLHWSFDISIPFGISLLGGIGVACPIAKHFELGVYYCLKFKILNDIRNDGNPHFQPITSPVLYHNANIGVSYRFN